MTNKLAIGCCCCESTSASYKCPTCRSPYCSAKCCQAHKAKGCQPLSPKKVEEAPTRSAYYPTEDTVPPEKLDMLRHSEAVRECLNNPHVRLIMEAIDKSENPTDLVAQAMLEPIFMEFATECLKVIQPDEINQQRDEFSQAI